MKTRNLSDFALFLSVMRNKEAYENVLSIILNEADLELLEVQVENVVLNEDGKRAIRLDAWARDKKDRHINTEMQNDVDHDDIPRRARFYQSLSDSPILKSGKSTRYRDLPESIVIFITQEDLFGKDRALYTFEERCKEVDGLQLGDGTKKLFLNMTSRNGREELVSLLQYMKDTRLDNPELSIVDPRITRLDEIVAEVKQSEEWEAVEMSIYSEGIERGRAEGLSQGRAEGLASGILELLSELGAVPSLLRERVLMQTDETVLRSWLRIASHANSIEEFCGQIQ